MTEDDLCRRGQKGRRARVGRMGGRLVRRRGRFRFIVLQHRADADGGTHEQGSASALSRCAANYAELSGNKRARYHRRRRDGRLPASCSVFIREPEFQGQTKEKLASAEALAHRRQGGARPFRPLADRPSGAGDKLLDWVLERADERLRRRPSVMSAARPRCASCACPASWPTVRLPAGRRRDVHRRRRLGRRLCQAGAQPQDQAILPLRGKILNVAARRLRQARANQQSPT